MDSNAVRSQVFLGRFSPSPLLEDSTFSFQRSAFNEYLRNLLKYLMFGRILIATSFLVTSAVMLYSGSPNPIFLEITYYSAVALAYSVLFGLVFQGVEDMEFFGFGQILADIFLVGVITARTGGVESLFTVAFLAIIIVGGALFETAGSYFVVLSCVTMFTIVTLLQLHGYAWLILSLPMAHNVLFSGYLTNISGFLGVVVLVNFISSQVRRSWIQIGIERSQLDQLRSLHEDVVVSIPSGIITTDSRLGITFFNQATESILRVSIEDMKGAFLDQVFGKELRNLAEQVVHDETIQVEHHQTWIKTKGEEHVYVDVTISKLFHEGTLAGLLIIVQDKTELKRMEGHIQAQTQLAAVGQMAAGIAHEIRNPLGAIHGSMQMLAKDLELKDYQKDLLDIVSRETRRLDNLVEEFLQFARPAKLLLSEVDLPKLLSEVKTLLTHKLTTDGKSIGIVTLLHNPQLKFPADEDRLRQVFWNLALNACQAMGNAGTLTIATSIASAVPTSTLGEELEVGLLGPPGASILRISFTDTGPGIPRQEFARIFQPFHSKKSGGLGLGLAMCRKIVETHGGKIDVYSTEGHGATFNVYLPLSGPPKEALLEK